MTKPTQFYAELDHWKRYQPFFPPELRCESSRLPEESYWRWRGVDVHIDRYPAPSAPVVLIVVHGAGGYGRLLAPCGLAAREGGAEVLAPDLPGYGLTRARRYTHDDWVECIRDLVAHERERDGRPVVLFGASMGGMIAYAAATRGDVAGLAATCFLDPRRLEVRRAVARHPWLGSVGEPLLRSLRPIAGRVRLPVRWLARASAMSGNARLNEIVLSDPVGGGNSVPIEFLASFMSWQPPVEPERFATCPVLLAHPGNDAWTPLAVSRPFFDALRVPKELVVLENAGHLPIEEPGLTQLRSALTSFLRACVA